MKCALELDYINQKKHYMRSTDTNIISCLWLRSNEELKDSNVVYGQTE